MRERLRRNSGAFLVLAGLFHERDVAPESGGREEVAGGGLDLQRQGSDVLKGDGGRKRRVGARARWALVEGLAVGEDREADEGRGQDALGYAALEGQGAVVAGEVPGGGGAGGE